MTRFRIPYGCRCFPMCCLVTGVVLVLVTMISDTPRRSSSVLRVPGFSLRLDVYGRMEEFMRSRSTVAPSTSTRASPLRDDLKVASKVLDTNWQPTAEISKHGQGENRTGPDNSGRLEPLIAGKEQSLKRLNSTAVTAVQETRKSNSTWKALLKRNFIPLSNSVIEHIEVFVFFLGYPRSGHSLVGALLDAHPHAVVAQEYNVAHMYNSNPNMSRETLFSELFTKTTAIDVVIGKRRVMPSPVFGNTSHSYSYGVPGQWQGRFDGHIKVIGDKKGGATTCFLAGKENAALFQEMLDKVGLPTRIVHVVRNPFDNIATMVLRSLGLRFVANETHPVDRESRLMRFAEKYFRMASTVLQYQRTKTFGPVLDVHTRDVKTQPREVLGKICSFMGLNCSEVYVESCASVIDRKLSKTRKLVVWSTAVKGFVQRRIAEFPFLTGYSFTSD